MGELAPLGRAKLAALPCCYANLAGFAPITLQGETYETVKSALLDGITELDAPYACDLHYYLYNLPDHFIYYASAREATAELDVWDCLYIVQRHGVGQTPLSDPCKVANMVVSLMGEELLYRIYGDLDEARRLPAEELEDMRLQAIRWFEKHPEGLLDIWEDLG